MQAALEPQVIQFSKNRLETPLSGCILEIQSTNAQRILSLGVLILLTLTLTLLIYGANALQSSTDGVVSIWTQTDNISNCHCYRGPEPVCCVMKRHSWLRNQRWKIVFRWFLVHGNKDVPIGKSAHFVKSVFSVCSSGCSAVCQTGSLVWRNPCTGFDWMSVSVEVSFVIFHAALQVLLE